MARITGLVPDPKRPGAVRVLVDGRAFCTVHEDVITAGTLAVGAEWEVERASVAGQAADEEGAWRALLRALEQRNFAVVELRRRLRRKGHTPEAIEFAIGRALAARLLDDRSFAQRFVESRAARGRGPSRLRRDLSALGVDRAHIESALAAHWPEPDDALALALDLARRRARQRAPLPREVQRRRLLAYLERRGFSGHRVSELVTRVLRGEPES
ncbi:MAG: regulatory protein RecX [Gemmatimonadota bacterium]